MPVQAPNEPSRPKKPTGLRVAGQNGCVDLELHRPAGITIAQLKAVLPSHLSELNCRFEGLAGFKPAIHSGANERLVRLTIPGSRGCNELDLCSKAVKAAYALAVREIRGLPSLDFIAMNMVTEGWCIVGLDKLYGAGKHLPSREEIRNVFLRVSRKPFALQRQGLLTVDKLDDSHIAVRPRKAFEGQVSTTALYGYTLMGSGLAYFMTT